MKWRGAAFRGSPGCERAVFERARSDEAPARLGDRQAVKIMLDLFKGAFGLFEFFRQVGQLRKSFVGETVELVARVIVGRAPGCELRLTDRRVSGEHASIYYEDGSWRIRDLASSNGTRVNGTALNPGERHALLEGDEICFGSYDEQWELCDETPPPEEGIRETAPVTVLLQQVSLVFRVSSDEEEVDLTVVTPRSRTRVPQRTFTRMLLFLARARENDRAADVRPSEQGWVHVDTLVPGLYSDTDTLNLNIFRARKQLEALGVGESNHLIERRFRSRRVRLGVAEVRIVKAPQTHRPDS